MHARAFAGILDERIRNNSSELTPVRINIDKKNHVGMKDCINNFLITEFCALFCNCEKLIVKIIKYSYERNRRFTIFSSIEEDNLMRVRMINDGTVGIMNNIFRQKKVAFPVVISNFVCSECYLLYTKFVY